MIEINCTLLIQGFNFLLAYFLMRIFLFRPAVDIIFQEKNKQNALVTAIASRKAAILTKEREKNEYWQAFQDRSKNKLPASEEIEYTTKKLFPLISSFSLSEEKAHALIHDITPLFIEKVRHVRW